MKYDLAFYRKFYEWVYLTGKKETTYNEDRTCSNVETSYSYNKANHQVSSQLVETGRNRQKVCYYFPSDSIDVNNTKLLNSVHKISELTSVDTYLNGVYLGGTEYRYSLHGQTGLPVVSRCYSIKPDRQKVLELEADSITGYDDYGNILEYKRKDGIPVSIVWSYNHQFPVMEIVGMRRSDCNPEIRKMIDALETKDGSTDIKSDVEKLHEKIRKLPCTMVTAYVYGPWNTVSNIIKPNGYKASYDYDKYGRLKSVSDEHGVIQDYDYHYGNNK